jgi:F-type H+-transporting ATPase subunit b
MERQRIVSEAQAAAQDIVAKAHANIDEERTKAMIELSGQVVDLSVEIAGKIIGEALDEEEHRELVKKYLSEMGSLNDDE